MGRVLVIDDERMFRDLMQQVLSRLQWTVDTAENAAEGLAKFDRGAYDLVITDVGVSGVDGHYVVHRIRCSDRGSTPVIGVSGTPRLLQGGDFDDVLHKPFAMQALLEKISCLTHLPISESAPAAATFTGMNAARKLSVRSR